MAAILRVGVFAATSAAVAVVIGNPIGAVGGAIYGGMYGVVNEAVNELTTINTSSFVTRLLVTIGTTAAAWKLSALCGVTMSFEAAAILGFASAVVGLSVIAIAVVAATVLSPRRN